MHRSIAGLAQGGVEAYMRSPGCRSVDSANEIRTIDPVHRSILAVAVVGACVANESVMSDGPWKGVDEVGWPSLEILSDLEPTVVSRHGARSDRPTDRVIRDRAESDGFVLAAKDEDEADDGDEKGRVHRRSMR